MRQKLALLLALVTLIGGMGFSADAVAAQSRAILCQCGGTMVVQSTQYADWVLAGSRKCIHDKEGTDAKKTQQVTYNRKCSSCGRKVTQTETRTKWECRGYTD